MEGKGIRVEGKGFPPEGKSFPPEGKGFPPEGKRFPPAGEGVRPARKRLPPDMDDGSVRTGASPARGDEDRWRIRSRTGYSENDSGTFEPPPSTTIVPRGESTALALVRGIFKGRSVAIVLVRRKTWVVPDASLPTTMAPS